MQRAVVTMNTGIDSLWKAIDQGDFEVAWRLLAHNRSLMLYPFSQVTYNLLRVAIQVGHQRIVETLLHYGANPNARNANWMTLKRLCVLYSRYQLLRPLFVRGANPAAVDRYNCTSLEMVATTNKRRYIL